MKKNKYSSPVSAKWRGVKKSFAILAIAVLVSPLCGDGIGMAQVCFNFATNYAAGNYPKSVCSADFNNDGKLDLATVSMTLNDVSVLLGNGAGSFGTATSFTAGIGPGHLQSIISADFNNDGFKDLVLVSQGTGVSILLGTGTGSFGIAATFAVSGAYSVISADFNADGNMDLATGGSSNISVLLGNGAGNFGPAANFAAGSNPMSVCSGDFNNDSKLDLATANNSSGDVSILPGDGAGSFGSATNFALGTCSNPNSICNADFNGDGNTDLAVAYTDCMASNYASILLGNGTGSFGTFTNFSVGTQPVSIISADFNTDGKMDLVTANGSSNNVSVLIGIGTGSFAAAFNFAIGGSPQSVCSADFNGDSKTDLATASGNLNAVTVLLNMGTNNFGAATNFAASGVQPSSIISCAGYGGSAPRGLVVTNQISSDVTVLSGNGAGNFNFSGNTIVGNNPQSVCSADFNADLAADLATANSGSDNITILKGSGIPGNFFSSTNFAVGSQPYSVITADFNGDTKLDLAVANSGSNNVSILLGTGTGSFGTATNFAAGFMPYSVCSGDFNGDGKIDLATANYGNTTVSVLLGDGTGNFGTATNFGAGASPRSVISADFNGDTKLDLAVANWGGNVSVLLGDGAGNFGTATNFAAGNTPASVTSADFNLDGKADLAVANYASSNVSVLFGTGTGSFGAATNYVVGNSPVSITSADFNGDGKIDLATANEGSNDLSVLLNTTLIISISGTTTICIGNSTTLQANGANTYVWSTGATTPSILVNPTSGTSYNVTGTSNSCINATTINVQVNALPTVSVNSMMICAGTTATLTASGAGTYSWSTTATTNTISVNPSIPTTYTVTGTDANTCTNTATGTVTESLNPAPDICMVTVDSLSKNNVIYWDKTSYPSAALFLVYRDTANNNYALIGSVPKTALSLFTDTSRHTGAVNGDPNITTYRYKLAIKDTCGNISAKSPYHNTVYTYNSGSMFFWNQYGIEGQATPVPALSSYVLKRDNVGGTGNYITAASAGAAATNINDPQYNTYQFIADWRVETNWTTVCTPTMRLGNNSTQGAIVRSKSNITNNRLTKIKQVVGIGNLAIYPNPNTGVFVIETNQKMHMQVFNIAGELVLSQFLENGSTTIDASVLQAGVYTINLSGNAGVINKRLVIVR